MKYEILEPDRYYHIYNQGNNKENIFREERNYTHFLKLTKKYILSVAEIYAYCLLPNHFHLIIKTNQNVENKLLSRAFSNLFNAYSKAFNKAYGRTGSLFRRKFSRIKIDDEEYLKNLILYVHTNPSHHQIYSDFKNYRHSSYQSYFSEKDSNLSRDYILTLFEGKNNFEFTHFQKLDKILNSVKELSLE